MTRVEPFDHGPLGRRVEAPARRDPDVLCGIPRAAARLAEGLPASPDFRGADLWTAWELFWLGTDGRPRARVLELDVPADSPCLVESKSLKLYLNSLNGERLGDEAALRAVLTEDLSPILGVTPDLRLLDEAAVRARGIDAPPGRSIDDAPLSVQDPRPEPGRLAAATAGSPVVEETLHSHLLRTLCPVTGQPDWATLLISYRGRAIEPARLLEYLLGYREHPGFHELCVERIFLDLLHHCAPERLSVRACYTRRGGIDIQPFRSTHERAGRALRPWRS